MREEREILDANVEEEIPPTKVNLHEKPIHSPRLELEQQPSDPPAPSTPTKDDFSDLTPQQKLGLKKWLVSSNLILYILGAMGALYIVDVIMSIIRPGTLIELRDPLFEALRMLLFAVSGYIFAKNSD